ncbi:MAG: FHA domain-containing protein [Anaerolineaceae bacterium]|nr:FHA domain-containing protein [Anaerolineaceae bacterium]
MLFLKNLIHRVFPTLLISLLLLTIPLTALAQGGFSLSLYSPDLGQFPKITLYLDAFDAQGQFIPSLDLNSFKVFEDGFERTLNETQLLEPGLHTIIAFNLGATLSNRANATVPTRYEETVFAVASWLNGLQSTAPNQYSLTSNEGALADSVQEKDTFTLRLQNYKPNLFNFQPDLDSLSLALDIAARPNLNPQGKQAILLITPLPLDQSLANLDTIRARALELQVPVNVWLVAPETAANAPAVEQLTVLASSTGGRFLFYPENLQQPKVEDYVGSLRGIYRLRYTSEVSQSGAHTVRVEGKYGNQTAVTPDTQFGIDLNLPTAVLVGLPDEVKREYVNSGGGKTLQPGFITLQANFLFPDGYERQLKSTRLYVDGVLITENQQEPYGVFAWPLNTYQFSGEHLLSVEVEDILGFRSISPPVSVMVTVESLYPAWLTSLMKFLSAGGWIPVAVVALGGTVIFSIRLRRRRLAILENDDAFFDDGNFDPLLQSVPGLGIGREEPGQETESKNSLIAAYEEQLPCLVWAGEAPSPIKDGMICIDQKEIIIGSDSNQCSFPVQAEGVSTQHACLVRHESGAVTIADLGSDVGTWVNFAPVSSRGLVLNDSDLVQIGSLTFRYCIGRFK